MVSLPRGERRGGGGRCLGLALGRRQIELDRGAVADLAVDPDMPARLLDEAVDHAQPEARALADFLGGEERLEHLVLHLLGHAGAGVADGKHHIGAGPHVGIGLRVGFVEHDVARLQQQLAAVRHRVAGVDRHVEHGVRKLRGVDMGGRHFLLEDRVDLDLLAERRTKQSCDIEHGAVDVDIARTQRLAAGEGEQMLDQLAAAFRRLVDQLGGLLQPRLVLEARDQRFGGAGDHGQHVVEVVRDAAGELADGVQFLRLQQLVFGFAPGGDVVVDQRRAGDGARGVAQRPAADREMQRRGPPAGRMTISCSSNVSPRSTCAEGMSFACSA